MNSSAPHFLGIGAPRAGTTWLHDQLSRHPQVWMPPVKEVHYFSRDPKYPSPNLLSDTSLLERLRLGRQFDRQRVRPLLGALASGKLERIRFGLRWFLGTYNDDWYRSLFQPHARTHLCGEITPAYSLLDDEDVARIKEFDPKLRFVYLLRDPVGRAWSGLRYSVARGWIDLDLGSTDAILQQVNSSVGTDARGDYSRTLEVYLRHFASRQILVGFYDAIERDPERLLEDIARFLGLDVAHLDRSELKARINASPQRAIPAPVREALREHYGPLVRAMAERFGGYAELWDSGQSAGESGPLPAPTAHP